MKRARRYDFAGKIGRPGEKRGDALTATPTSHGFLRVEGRIMRDGSLEYSDGQSTWREYRSREEIEASLPSFANSVVTLDHPADMVNVDNVRELDQGHLGSRMGWDEDLPDHVRVDMLITGKDALDAIERGVAELSVGFTAMVVPQSGIDAAGQPYSFVQTEIEGNHVAIVEEGRAGPDARLLLDSKTKTHDGVPLAAFTVRTDSRERNDNEETTMETVDIEIDGKTVTVPKEAADLIAEQSAKIEQMGEEPPEGEEEEEEPTDSHQTPRDAKDSAPTLVKLQARCDAQEAELAKLKTAEAQRSRTNLLDTAKRIGAKVDASKAKTDHDIMRAVVLDRRPELKPKLEQHAETPGYLRALFDEVVDAADLDTSRSVTRSVNLAALDGGKEFEFRDHMDELIKPKTESEAG